MFEQEGALALTPRSRAGAVTSRDNEHAERGSPMDVDGETGELVITTDVYFCEKTARAVFELFGVIVTGTIVQRRDGRMLVELDDTGVTVAVEGTATTAS